MSVRAVLYIIRNISLQIY